MGDLVDAEILVDAAAVCRDYTDHFGHVHRRAAAQCYDRRALFFFVEPLARVHAAGRWVGQCAIKDGIRYLGLL
jgi:hypothetical protein